MSPPLKDAAILVLTEDGGKDGKHAFETVKSLVKRLLVFLDTRCQTNRIDFTPANDEAREILVGNKFVGTGAAARRDPRRRQLYQVIAAQLRLDDGFVIHHFDGDCPWRDRDVRAPLEAKPIQRDILDHVRALLELNNVPPAEIDTMLARYLRLVPYREIEAWLYQNTEVARRLVCGMPHCGCLARLDRWRADRTLLDEIPDPPAELACVGKAHNRALTDAFPTQAVYEARKSLQTSVDAMFECPALLHAIERTYNRSPTSPA